MRTQASSGSPYEPTIGFSRAVRVGNRIVVAGTAPIGSDLGSWAPGDPEAQASRCWEIVIRAIVELGGEARHVVRTRTYLVRAEDWEAAGRAHGKFFADVRPVSTMVVVAALLNPDWLVEVEAEAIVSD